MLDGKFSVYNGNGAPQGPPPAAKAGPAPINFKFESASKTKLSFEDELRMTMQQFNKAKEPTPAKELFSQWYQAGPAKWLSFLDKKIELPKSTPVPKQTSSKTQVDVISFKIPKIELPKIEFPKFDLDAKLEKLGAKFKENMRELREKIEEKKEDWTEALWEKIPHEWMAEMAHFIAEIPQQYIIPACTWLVSFIPKEAIQSHLQSGIDRVTRFATATYGYALRGYNFCERHIAALAHYINTTYILPVANFLERLFRAIWNWLVVVAKRLYPHLKRAAIALYRFSLTLPRRSVAFSKLLWRGLKRLTVWLVE